MNDLRSDLEEIITRSQWSLDQSLDDLRNQMNEIRDVAQFALRDHLAKSS
jgi:hypothetical protein